MATATKKPEDGKVEDGELDTNVSAELGEDLEVEVVDDTPAKDKGRKPLEKAVEEPTEDELEEYSATVKKRIKELTHARHDERRRAETLQRERDELQQVAQRLLTDRKAMEQRYNAGAVEYGKVALEGAEAALAKAKAELRAAHDAFDTDKIVEAQGALAEATVRLERAKSYKVPDVSTTNKEEKVVQTQQPQQVQPDSKALNWQAKNQWFGRSGNEDATSYALGLHQKLVNSGADPRSDEYYEQIDARVQAKFPELFDEDGEAEPQKNLKKPATVVAPATRTQAGPGKVRLTQTQVALAKRLGLTPQQYAAQVVKLQKDA